MRIAYSATKRTNNCPVEQPDCACGEVPERLSIRCQVHSRPKCITFFGLCDDDVLNVNRLLGCNCWFEKPIVDCNGDPLRITCENCEVMLIKPGLYEFVMQDRSEIIEEIEYEAYDIGVEWSRLICECGDVNYA